MRILPAPEGTSPGRPGGSEKLTPPQGAGCTTVTAMTPRPRKPPPRRRAASPAAATRKPVPAPAPAGPLEALARVGAELAATLDVAQVTDRVARAAVEILGVARSVVYRLEPASGALVCVAEAAPKGKRPLRWIGQTLPAGTGVSGRAVAQRRVVWCPDQLADPDLRLP